MNVNKKEERHKNLEYFFSILGNMNKELNRLIENNTIDKLTKIAVVGVDEYSFAIRTLLEHQNMKVDCYLEDDAEMRQSYKNRVRGACARYFNKTNEYIHVYTTEEWLSGVGRNSVVLFASKDCENEIEIIDQSKRLSSEKICCLYSWKHGEYAKMADGKQRITLDELKKIEKDILMYFDQFCEKNSLRYWVSGGTMLGALRHKGFIPWDDDIDVFMPDVDYDRFLELIKKENLYECHIVDDYDDVWGHYKFSRLFDKRTLFIENYPFYRHYLGVNIEILPIVGVPQNKEERMAYMRKYEDFNIMRKKYFFDCDGNMDKFRQKYGSQILSPERFDDSEYVGVLGTGYYERDCTSRSVYDETLRVSFEDIEVNIPKGYQEYLDTLYGKGWEELPSESKRTAKHNFEAYWL